MNVLVSRAALVKLQSLQSCILVSFVCFVFLCGNARAESHDKLAILIYFATDRELTIDTTAGLTYSDTHLDQNKLNLGVKNFVIVGPDVHKNVSERSSGLGWWAPVGNSSDKPATVTKTLTETELLSDVYDDKEWVAQTIKCCGSTDVSDQKVESIKQVMRQCLEKAASSYTDLLAKQDAKDEVSKRLNALSAEHSETNKLMKRLEEFLVTSEKLRAEADSALEKSSQPAATNPRPSSVKDVEGVSIKKASGEQ